MTQAFVDRDHTDRDHTDRDHTTRRRMGEKVVIGNSQLCYSGGHVMDNFTAGYDKIKINGTEKYIHLVKSQMNQNY